MAVHAVIVAGGEGSRLAAAAPEGTPTKPLLTRKNNTRLIDGSLTATEGFTSRVVVAGPMELPEDVIQVREDPPLSGPAAAIATGVRALHNADRDDPVILLAADLVDPGPAVEILLEAFRTTVGEHGVDGCIAVLDGRRQPLLSVVTYSSLTNAIGDEDFVNTPVKAILRELDLREVTVDSAEDIDTWEEALKHGFGGDHDG